MATYSGAILIREDGERIPDAVAVVAVSNYCLILGRISFTHVGGNPDWN